MSEDVRWDELDVLCREIRKTETPGEAMLLCGLWGRRDGWEPRAQYEVAGYRIDIGIPEAKIAIESDGFEHHSSNAALERDHRRQNALVSAGWTPLRYTAQQSFMTSGKAAVDALREINKRLRGRPGEQRRPNQPSMATPMTDGERKAAAEAAKAFLKALGSIPEDGVIPRRRAHGR